MASSLCPCCRRSNKLTPQVTTENDNVTGVTISSEDDSDHEPDTYTSWSRLFKKFFHGSPDNRLVFKLFGSRKGVLRERLKPRKDHGSKWMIHPLSRFRYDQIVTDCYPIVYICSWYVLTNLFCCVV